MITVCRLVCCVCWHILSVRSRCPHSAFSTYFRVPAQPSPWPPPSDGKLNYATNPSYIWFMRITCEHHLWSVACRGGWHGFCWTSITLHLHCPWFWYLEGKTSQKTSTLGSCRPAFVWCVNSNVIISKPGQFQSSFVPATIGRIHILCDITKRRSVSILHQAHPLCVSVARQMVVPAPGLEMWWLTKFARACPEKPDLCVTWPTNKVLILPHATMGDRRSTQQFMHNTKVGSPLLDARLHILKEFIKIPHGGRKWSIHLLAPYENEWMSAAVISLSFCYHIHAIHYITRVKTGKHYPLETAV